MRRPGGITVLSLILGWLTLGAAGNAHLILTGQFGGFPNYLGVFAVAYGISALMACVGLWRMKRWGLNWLRAWMLVCLCMIVAMAPSMYQIALDGIFGIAVFFVIVAGLFWLLNAYVARRLTGAQ